MKKKYNSVYLGLSIGIIVPLITLFIYSLVNKYNINISEIIQTFFRDDLYSSIKKEILIKVLSLCIIPNLLAFFGFLQIDRLLSARGVLIATFFYGLVIVVFKFII